MKEIKRVLIAGAGAIGSMVARELSRGDGIETAILAAGPRLGRYRKDGFVLNGEKAGFEIADAAEPGQWDLVVVACKFHHLSQVMDDLQNHVGPDTIILSLLNGVSSEELLRKRFPLARVPLAMIIGTDAGREGNATVYSNEGTIFFGDGENAENPAEWSAPVRSIAALFDRCAISYTVPRNMRNRLWYKFMMNVGLNQTTAVLRESYRILQTPTRIPEAAELFESAMREVALVAAAEGVVLTDGDVREMYRVLDTLSPEGKTSMCQDVEAGRKTEVEMFALAVMELGKKHGIEVPVNETLYRLLRVIEQAAGVRGS